MTLQEYKDEINKILFNMIGEDVVHDVFGVGTIIGFEDNKCVVSYDKFEEYKHMSIDKFFDFNTPVLQKTQDDIDAIKVDYELSQNKHKIKKVNRKIINNDGNINRITFNDVIGLDNVKELVNQLIVYPYKYKEIYRMFKRNGGGGVLLYGAPGNGKTLIAKAIANEIDAKFFSIKCSDITSKWYGESERKIKELFEKAKEADKSIIFFDEFDSLGSSRDNKTLGSNNRIVSELLSQIDGFDNNSNILVLASTNKPWDIDSALIRSGRFSKKIYIGLPDVKSREELFKHELRNIPHDNLKFSEYSLSTDGYSNADIVEVCNEAKDKAISRSIQNGCISKLNNDDINMTIKLFKPTVSKDELKKLLSYK